MQQHEYTSQVVRITDLAVTRDVIEGVNFVDCHIIGPAVLLPLGEIGMNDCQFPADRDVIFWRVDPEHPDVMGAIGISNCSFERCRFDRIGMAGLPKFYDQLPVKSDA